MIDGYIQLILSNKSDSRIIYHYCKLDSNATRQCSDIDRFDIRTKTTYIWSLGNTVYCQV